MLSTLLLLQCNFGLLQTSLSAQQAVRPQHERRHCSTVILTTRNPSPELHVITVGADGRSYACFRVSSWFPPFLLLHLKEASTASGSGTKRLPLSVTQSGSPDCMWSDGARQCASAWTICSLVFSSYSLKIREEYTALEYALEDLSTAVSTGRRIPPFVGEKVLESPVELMWEYLPDSECLGDSNRTYHVPQLFMIGDSTMRNLYERILQKMPRMRTRIAYRPIAGKFARAMLPGHWDENGGGSGRSKRLSHLIATLMSRFVSDSGLANPIAGCAVVFNMAGLHYAAYGDIADFDSALPGNTHCWERSARFASCNLRLTHHHPMFQLLLLGLRKSTC